MIKSPKASDQRIVRCAVYTRKSTEEGLEQEFNSLDAQRESAEAYIKSQKQAGWVCVPKRYDDGGFTGGNLDRPALKRLMADIDAGNHDLVFVVFACSYGLAAICWLGVNAGKPIFAKPAAP